MRRFPHQKETEMIRLTLTHKTKTLTVNGAKKMYVKRCECTLKASNNSARLAVVSDKL